MNDFRLSARELDAAIEALNMRVAGEIDGDELPPIRSYRSVLSKLQDLRAQVPKNAVLRIWFS